MESNSCGKETAQEISEAHQERLKPFPFSMCNIAVGEKVEFCDNGSEKSGTLCTVADDKHVEYEGKTWSLTALDKHLLGDVKWALTGPHYFKFKGEWLNDIRYRLGV